MIRVLCLTGFLGQRDDLSLLRRWEVAGKLEFEFFEVQDLLKNNILNFEKAWEKINEWAVEKKLQRRFGIFFGWKIIDGSPKCSTRIMEKGSDSFLPSRA
jgi:hypothetical protein